MGSPSGFNLKNGLRPYNLNEQLRAATRFAHRRVKSVRKDIFPFLNERDPTCKSRGCTRAFTFASSRAVEALNKMAARSSELRPRRRRCAVACR